MRRWITDREQGGVLEPHKSVGSGEATKSVPQILEDRHPATKDPDRHIMEKAISSDLPHLVNVEVTSCHVEKPARQIHGGAGPGGCDSS